MHEIQAPNLIKGFVKKLLFLAGSIEMGKAEMWQDRVIKELENTDWIVLNPRRNDWDSTWKQSIDNEKFFEQVSWELDGLEKASTVLFYFDPNTKSPITLLELGLMVNMYGENFSPEVLVVCPEPFYRKGNVDIVCKRYGIKQLDSLTEAIKYLNSPQSK